MQPSPFSLCLHLLPSLDDVEPHLSCLWWNRALPKEGSGNWDKRADEERENKAGKGEEWEGVSKWIARTVHLLSANTKIFFFFFFLNKIQNLGFEFKCKQTGFRYKQVPVRVGSNISIKIYILSKKQF